MMIQLEYQPTKVGRNNEIYGVQRKFSYKKHKDYLTCFTKNIMN